MFERSVYINRRENLKKKVGKGTILFLGNSYSPMNYKDNYYHFRQDSTFLYYFGISRPDLFAVIDIENDKEIIFGDEYTVDDVIWVGKQASLKSLAENVGIEDIREKSKVYEYFSNSDQVHFLPGYRGNHIVELAKVLNINNQKAENGFSEVLIESIVSQRNIKSSEEIKQMHEAANITCNMHEKAMSFAKPGMSELDIVAAVHGEALKGGGNISFPIILSINSQILHNHSHDNLLDDSRLLLVDCGAENRMGYAGDMTRTFPIVSRFSQKQAEIYEIVLTAQNTAISMLKPGITYSDVHLSVASVIAEGLKGIGVLTGSVDSLVSTGAYALFMPHGLGHSIGLDVHDMENLGEDFVGYDKSIKRSEQFGIRSLRYGKELVPGIALTVEPGVYFIPDLINQWEGEGRHKDLINYDKLPEYLNFGGVRIEDDYVITDEGANLLGREVAKEIKDVEQVRYNAING